MATWTTYGTWLPGDERGYVNNKGQTLDNDKKLFQKSRTLQKSQTVKLNSSEKKFIKQAILDDALKINHKIIELAVCTNHVHLLAKPHRQSIEDLIGRYKSVTTRDLWEYGRKGKVWTRGFDRQYCWTEKEITARIIYIQRHND